jgi:hypothetical protein
MFTSIPEVLSQEQWYTCFCDIKVRNAKYYKYYKKVSSNMFDEEHFPEGLNSFLKYVNSHYTTAVVAGGRCTAFYYEKKWTSDIDIFINNDIFKNMLDYPYALFLKDYKIENISSLNYYNHKNAISNGIKSVIQFTKDNYIIQFIVINKCFTPLDIVNNFDLDICKIFYNGFKMYKHPSLDKHNYTFTSSKFYNIRCKKYYERGFSYKQNQNDIYMKKNKIVDLKEEKDYVKIENNKSDDILCEHDVNYQDPIVKISYDIYDGEWINDEKHGQGKYTQSTGEIREGQWINDRFTGTGSYRNKHGDVYTGEWKDDRSEGEGILLKVNGNLYTGEFLNGCINGKGIYTQSTGEIREGIWKKNKFTGTGSYRSKNGDVYTGEWKDGQKHGKGIYIIV